MRVCSWAFLSRGDDNQGERQLRGSGDDGTMTLCPLRADSFLSRKCSAQFDTPRTRRGYSHLRDGALSLRTPRATSYLSCLGAGFSAVNVQWLISRWMISILQGSDISAVNVQWISRWKISSGISADKEHICTPWRTLLLLLLLSMTMTKQLDLP